jgi:hypothetical protein
MNMQSARSFRNIVAGAIGILLLAAATWASADAGKEADLRQAFETIRRAEQDILARMGLAETVKSRLVLEKEGLKAEIRDEQRRLKVPNYASAARVTRIDNDLKLLQRLTGYTDQLENRLAEFKVALACLERYRERIRDEAGMVRTLNDAEIGDLLRDLSAMIQDVGTRCGSPLLSLPATERAAESIWADILQGR